MPDVIVNTSPLQYLHQIGLLEQLASLGFRLKGRTRQNILRLANEG